MDAATVGFSIIGILQIANLAWTGHMSRKLDGMITDDRCLERRAACAADKVTAIDQQKRELKAVERKMNHHVHNGGGTVKYQPVDL